MTNPLSNFLFSFYLYFKKEDIVKDKVQAQGKELKSAELPPTVFKKEDIVKD